MINQDLVFRKYIAKVVIMMCRLVLLVKAVLLGCALGRVIDS